MQRVADATGGALLELFYVDTLDFAYDDGADPMREGKMAAQLAFLRIAMAACLDGERVERAAVAGKVRAEANSRRARMACGAGGFGDDGGLRGLPCDGCLKRPVVVSSMAGHMDVVRCGDGVLMVFCPARAALPGGGLEALPEVG